MNYAKKSNSRDHYYSRYLQNKYRADIKPVAKNERTPMYGPTVKADLSDDIVCGCLSNCQNMI